MKRLLLLLCLIFVFACGCTEDQTNNSTPATKAPTETPATPTPTEAPTPMTDPDAKQVTLDFEQRYQTIDGFGAGFTWYAEKLFFVPNPTEAFDLLFRDAGFTILRFKNEYGYGEENTFNTVAGRNLRYYTEAKTRADERNEKVTVLYSSWSPPASLKSNNDINGGGTLKKDADGNYVYEDFAKWWSDSVAAYRAKGIPVDFVSIQNEADYQAGYDGCEFTSDESGGLASYAKAFLATYRRFGTDFSEDAPKMIAPETMTCDPTTLRSYIREIVAEEPTSIYALAHHLYKGGTSTDDPNECAPDSFLLNFRNDNQLAKDYGLKKWQTEFYRGTALQTANVINNTLVHENANAYIFWGGVWIGASNDDMDNGSLIIVNSRFRYGEEPKGYLATGNYYAMRHFSQFIRPGYERIDVTPSISKDLRVSAYASPDNTTVVLVMMNNGTEPLKVQLPLDNYNAASSQCYQSVFTLGYTADMMYKDLGALGDSRVLSLPGESVTTIVINGATK